MRYLKSYKLFESSWTIEEYIDSITNELEKWNILPLHIKRIVDNNIDDIQLSIELGKSPIEYSNNLIKDLDLERGGYLGFMNNQKSGGEIKYL
jgi:hypothetical protein